MEKFDYQLYRDNLAKEIKQDPDKDKRKEILDNTKETEEYQEAEKMRREEHAIDESEEKESPEQTEEQRRIDNYAKMLEVLKMFGTEDSKDNFLDLIEQYYQSYRAQKISDTTGVIQELETQRASLHNKIMLIIQRLSLSPKITEEQQIVLTILANRNKVNSMVSDYLDVKLHLKHPKITKLGRMREGYFDDYSTT